MKYTIARITRSVAPWYLVSVVSYTSLGFEERHAYLPPQELHLPNEAPKLPDGLRLEARLVVSGTATSGTIGSPQVNFNDWGPGVFNDASK